MKAIVFLLSVSIATVLMANDYLPDDDYGGYLAAINTPTLAPTDCKCELCDCIDCDGNCEQAKSPIKTVSVRKPVLDRLDAEIALLNANEVTSKGRQAPNHVATQSGDWKWVQTGSQRVQVGTSMVCNGRSCQAVPKYETRAVYGWKFQPTAKAASRPAQVTPAKSKGASVPIRFAGGLANNDYAPPMPDGMTYDNPPTPNNSAVSPQSYSGGYSVEGPYSGSYAYRGGCSGEASGGCSGSGGCAGGGSGGPRGILGRLFGRRRG